MKEIFAEKIAKIGERVINIAPYVPGLNKPEKYRRKEKFCVIFIYLLSLKLNYLSIKRKERLPKTMNRECSPVLHLGILLILL